MENIEIEQKNKEKKPFNTKKIFKEMNIPPLSNTAR